MMTIQELLDWLKTEKRILKKSLEQERGYDSEYPSGMLEAYRDIIRHIELKLVKENEPGPEPLPEPDPGQPVIIVGG